MKARAIFSLDKLMLKQQMTLLVGIAVVMMAGTQFFFYFQFQSLSLERAERYAESLVNQVAEQLEVNIRNMELGGTTVAYNRYVQEYLITDDPVRKHIDLFPFVSDILEYVKSSNENIYDIILAGTDGRIITSLSNTNSYIDDIQQVLYRDYRTINDDFILPVHTPPLNIRDSESHLSYFYAYIVPIFSINRGDRFFEKIGSCAIVSHADSIERIIADIQLAENSDFIVLGRDNTIMAANKAGERGNNFGSLYPFTIEEAPRENTITENRAGTIVQYRQLTRTGWKVISLIPERELSADMLSIRRFGLLVGIVTALALVASGAAFIRNITMPVSEVVNFIEQVGKGNESKRLEIPSPNEVGIIADYINRMLGKIEKDTDTLLQTQKQYHETELLKKEAELSALQNQINPHFLYNTLNCISSIALVNDISEIVTISEAMVRIYRYGVKQPDLVFVEDEIALIKDYMEIMNIRYPGRFTLRVSVDDEIMKMTTIKMILQPLAENAVYHGLEPKNGPGDLVIAGGRVSENAIEIGIKDNGMGMEKSELEDIRKALNAEAETNADAESAPGTKRGIGIININRRIRLMFGAEYGIKIESHENNGTRVLVTLPIIQE